MLNKYLRRYLNHTVCCFATVFGIVLIITFPQQIQAQDNQRYEFQHAQMGTLFRIILYAPDREIAKTATDSAFQRINYLNSIMSDYLQSSELNKLTESSGDGTFIPVSRDLFYVISEAQSLSKQTDGAFDITIGPYVRLWRALNQRLNPMLPDKKTLDKISQYVGFQHVITDRNKQRIALNSPHMQLDLGGIAKGYAADEALDVLQFFGIESALVDAGGDISVSKAPPGKNGWHISIPYHISHKELNYITLILANRAVATSGDLFQYVEINGKRYSHIIDPQTGLGLTNQSMVTVVASSGIMADSYASALSVLGPAKGIEFIESKPDIHARFEYINNGDIYEVESAGFNQLVNTPQAEHDSE